MRRLTLSERPAERVSYNVNIINIMRLAALLIIAVRPAFNAAPRVKQYFNDYALAEPVIVAAANRIFRTSVNHGAVSFRELSGF